MLQRAATGITTFYQFWYANQFHSVNNAKLTQLVTVWLRVYVVPLFGAYIADTYLGRFRTVCWALGVALIGHILLIISAVPGVIEHPHGALACFLIALIVMGLGALLLYRVGLPGV